MADAPVTAEEILSHFSPPLPGPSVQPRVSKDVEMLDPSTGHTVDVPPGAAEQAWTHGRLNLLPGSEVPVQLADGRLGTVPAENAEEAISGGAHIVSPAEVHHARVARDVGAPEAAAYGFGRGFLPAVPGTPLGGDKFLQDVTGIFGGDPEAVRERQQIGVEEHPWATGAGELAGLVGQTALLPKGGPIGAVGALGERGALAALGERAPTWLGRVLTQGARGAAEGAFIGATDPTHEAALTGSDADLTAEKVLAGIGHSALVGGLTGSLFGGIFGGLTSEAESAAKAAKPKEVTLPKASPEAVQQLAERKFGYSPDGLGEAYVQASSGMAGGGEDIVRAAGIQNWSKEAKALRRNLLEADEVQAQSVRTLRAHADDLLSAAREVTEEAKGDLKREYVRKAVSGANPEAVGASTWDTVQKLYANVEDMLAKPQEFGERRTLKSVKEYLQRENDKLLTAVKAGDVAEQFSAFDDIKRSFQRWTKAAQSVERKADAYDLLRGRATRDRLNELAEGLRTHLEDESLWGKAGADQKAINAAWTRQLDAQSRFDRALTTEVGRDPNNPYRQIRGVDPAKLESYARQLVAPNQDLTHQAVRDYVESTAQLVSAIRQAYDIPPAKIAQVDRALHAAQSFRTTLQSTEQRLVRVNQLQKLLEAERGSDAGLVGSAVLGALLGPLGVPATAGLSALMKPGRSMMQLAQVERLVEKTNSKLSRGMADLFRFGREGAEKETARAPRRVEFAQKVEELQKAQANPEAFRNHVVQQLGPVAERSPKVAESVAARATLLTQLLLESAPAGTTVDYLRPTRALPPSDAQIDRWLRYAAVIEDPTRALDSMRRGQLTREEVRALRDGYPKLYEEMRGRVLQRVQSDEKPLSRQQKLQLWLLFDTPADSTMTPAAIISAQAAYAQLPQGDKPTPPKSGVLRTKDSLSLTR
jgi:hypothetical protein